MSAPELLAGRYRLDRRLGEGGMGQVHAGFDTLLQRVVAIKTLNADTEHDAHARARLQREALAAAALDHPFICKVFEVGEHEGRRFIVMEFVEGRTLETAIAERALTPRQVLDVSHQIAQALDEAHRRGMVHRDLKPSNIMLTTQGHVKVLDFGLAKHTDESSDGAMTAAAVGMTRPGTRLGTPSYMSPEQVLGSPLDARSDVFSLGVVLHELASGQHPFRKQNAADTMAAILRDAPLSTEGDLDLVPGFGRVVQRMLAKACAERFQTMRDLSSELDALRDRALSGTPGSGAVSVAAAPAERTAFVARDAELDDLRAHLDRMLLGHGGLVLLGGEPGVGKTRLARELLGLAHARGCVALTGHCYEQEGAPPFGPFIETMEHLLRMVPQSVRATLGDLAPEMAMMVPEIRRIFPDVPALPPIPPEQQRRVLFNAYLTYVQRATAKSAAVVLLDDLHWADDSTVQLLLHVVPHLSSLRLLFVGTYRDVDLDDRRPFAKALETMLRQRLAARASVKRLGLSGVTQLIEAMGGSAPPERLVRAVHEETEGNPFFVEEVFHHLREEGKLFDERGQWRASLAAGDIDVPEGVRLVITRRLSRLGDASRKVLAAAAVIGRSFPLDLLEVVAGVSEDALLDIVEEAERAQLLQAERGREARYTFVHELIRSTLLGELSLPRRQRLHVRAADAIEQRRASTLDSHISMLAHHLYQAGAAADQDRVVAAIARAMQRARDAGAFEEALELAEQLLALEVDLQDETKAQVDEVRVDALYALGRFDEAIIAAEQLLALSMSCGDHGRTASACFSISKLAAWTNRPELGIAVQVRALAALPADALAARATMLGGYTNVLFNVGRMGDARAACTEAIATAEQSGNDELLMVAVATRIAPDVWIGRPREALQAAERALGLAAQSRNPIIGYIAMMRPFCMLLLGRLTEIDAVLPECEALIRRSGHPIAPWFLHFTRARLTLARAGDLSPLRRLAELDLTRQLPMVARQAANQLAETLLYAGDAAAAVQALTDTLRVPLPIMGCAGEANLFVVHAWGSAVPEGRAVWAGIADQVIRARPNDVAWPGVYALAFAALGLSLVGDDEACGALHPGLEALLAEGHVCSVNEIGPTSPHLAAAVSAAAAGLHDRAQAYFEDALRLADTRTVAAAHRAHVVRPLPRLAWRRCVRARAGHAARRGGGFRPARDAASSRARGEVGGGRMSLTSGTRIGPYEVLGSLGAGGLVRRSPRGVVDDR